MPTAFLTRLRGLVSLSEDGSRAVQQAFGNRRAYAAGQDLVLEHDAPDGMSIVISGMGGRYRSLPNGKRQYVGFLIPGDLLDFGSIDNARADCGVMAFGPIIIARISAEELVALMARHPTLARGFWKAAVQDLSLSREWTVNIGRRGAEQRIAHLLCEQYYRMSAIGQTRNDSFAFPLTQRDLADSTGLTNVHVNRVLQRLRRDKLFTFEHGVCTILDIEGLSQRGSFDPSYLRLPAPPAPDAAQRPAAARREPLLPTS